ncbi:HTH domain protein [Enterococcus ratti]|uniref:HTH domain protein n=2 Tax=Enterococcus ratti TaxID=150033 RepID=A0A1L8W8J3_9ENTE|nr:HTH domain protein [Enterococcus ratti]
MAKGVFIYRNIRSDDRMEQLNILESDVLDLIPIGQERKISIKEIGQLLNVDERIIYEAVNSLRKKGVPVCAKRNGDNRGYFIATTEKERIEGLSAYKAQVKDMTKLIDQIEGADLEHWQENIERVK